MKVKYFPAIAGIVALVLVTTLIVTILQGSKMETDLPAQEASETVTQNEPTPPAESNTSVKQTVSAPDAVISTVEIE